MSESWKAGAGERSAQEVLGQTSLEPDQNTVTCEHQSKANNIQSQSPTLHLKSSTDQILKIINESGLVVHTCELSAQEVEAEG